MEEKGISVASLAEGAEISRNTVHEIINRPDRTPHRRTLRKIADHLGVNVAWLSGGVESPDATSGPMEAQTYDMMWKAEYASIWNAVDGAMAASDGQLRGYQTKAPVTCFGIPPGSTILVDTMALPRSGDIVVIEAEGGAAEIRYYVEPYLVGIGPGGTAFHEVISTANRIAGRAIVAFLPLRA